MFQINLPVKHASEYDGRFPDFRQPSELGCFSLDSDRKFRNDNSQLKYLSIPPAGAELHMDLSEGYSQVISKDLKEFSEEKIDAILRWIVSNRETISESFRVSDKGNPVIDFVCFRGRMTEICATIYENKDDWIICATKFKSTIYICGFETNQKNQRKANETARDKLMSSWGYKFEQYMTSDTPHGKPVTNVPVNEKEEYCIVLKGGLNDHVLLYSAEMDGVDPNYLQEKTKHPSSTNCYVELKTSRIITAERQNQTFLRFKLLKWWIQSFLVATPKIVAGFRDDNGYVQHLRTFDLKELPKMAERFWSPSACLNFCSNFFDFVKRCAVKDNPSVVYKFYFKPGKAITCEELASPSPYQILPEWYISEMENTL